MALSKILPASQEQYAGARNLIINGAMQVAQRGTSSTGITSGQYHTVDRQKLEVNTAGTWTAAQSTTAPTDFVNSLKYDCTVADASLGTGDYVFHSYNIEGQDLQHLNYGTSSAKKTTVSFYVRSNKTGTYTFEYQIYDGSTYYRNGKTYTIDSADTWEYKTITIDGNTSNSIVNSTAAGLTLIWWLAAGTDFTSGTFNNGTWITSNTERVANTVNLADSTSNEWLITGVQLEVGEQATPFEHRSYADTIRQCRRYFSRFRADSTAAALLTFAVWSSATKYGRLDFPVEMRTNPTFTVSDNSHFSMLIAGSTSPPTSFTLNSGDTTYAELNVTTASFGSAGQSGWMRVVNTSGYADLDAEL